MMLLDPKPTRARQWVAASCRVARAEVLAETAATQEERDGHLKTISDALALQLAIEDQVRAELKEKP